MTLLGGAAVLIATQQSRGKPAFLAVLLPLTLLEPALLIAFHQNLMQVVRTRSGDGAAPLGTCSPIRAPTARRVLAP